jgi:hypothetical protein
LQRAADLPWWGMTIQQKTLALQFLNLLPSENHAAIFNFAEHNHVWLNPFMIARGKRLVVCRDDAFDLFI